MTLFRIRLFPDPILRQICRPVEAVTPDVTSLLDDMVETMREADGVGLAAPQIGEDVRAIVIDVSHRQVDEPLLKMINPEIIEKSPEKTKGQEGCLSLPGQYADIERAETLTVSYQDEKGRKQERKAEGLLAVCIQHEVDHLNGVLFIDYLSALKRGMIARKMKKMAR